jgi:hypothetical protein
VNLKQLVLKVSEEISLPASEVRKVINSALEVLRSNVEAGENFTSSRLNIKAITLKPTERVDEKGVKISVPERKTGRLVLKEPKIKE